LAVKFDVFLRVKHSVAANENREDSRWSHRLVSSTAGQRGEAFHCDYAASKGALFSMVKGCRPNSRKTGSTFNCVAPGWVATDMSAYA